MAFHQGQVPRPVRRSPVRRAVGREMYVLRRKYRDARGPNRWAAIPPGWSSDQDVVTSHLVFAHSSLIRRKLANVDMRLQENKATNLRLAVRCLDGVTIQPGEVFSLWRLVGRPTVRKGYLPGLILDQGTVGEGVGGGLCQLSNLLFWLFAHSDLTIAERHRHLFDVFPDTGRMVPFGAGATIAYNYIDLRVRNDSSASFTVRLNVDDTHLNGSLHRSLADDREYRVVEQDHRFDQQHWGGYSRHNRIVRQVLVDSVVVDQSVLAVNDALVVYSPMLDSDREGEKPN